MTTSLALLLILTYGLTSYPNHFQSPVNTAVYLGFFYPPAVEAGEWWRIVTGTMMHANPGHLFNNVVGVLLFGSLLEPVVGPFFMLMLCVLSALAGAALFFIFQPQSASVGASAIDYGLIGAYLALILRLRYRQDRPTFFRELRGALFFVLMFIGWNWMESMKVSLWGHLGGFLAGVLTTFAFRLQNRDETDF